MKMRTEATEEIEVLVPSDVYFTVTRDTMFGKRNYFVIRIHATDESPQKAREKLLETKSRLAKVLA